MPLKDGIDKEGTEGRDLLPELGEITVRLQELEAVNVQLNAELAARQNLMSKVEVFRMSDRITVVHCGEQRYAVRDGSITRTRAGGWVIEKRPSNRDDDYLETVRYALQEALDIAADEVRKDCEIKTALGDTAPQG
jgi:hypothetical protein